MNPQPLKYTLFPYTTLFRSKKLLIHIEESRYKTELMAFLEKVEHFSFPVEVINVYEEVAKRFWKYHQTDRKSTRLNSSHVAISYAVFCLKKKKKKKKKQR